MKPDLIEHFSHIEDPRIERHRKHALIDIIVLSVCAVCSGATGWESIEEFGREKLEWLRQFVPLENGVPSHDCISYVLSRLSQKTFSDCFFNWTTSFAKINEGEVIAIDGKTARGSRDRKNEGSPLHMVSAWACQQRLVLAQQATDQKSNEITAIPKLLELLEIKGCIITIDAMGCQKAIAKQIVDQQGDYVLGLKGNQGNLHSEVEETLTAALENEFADMAHDYTEEHDKGHGRIETRRYWVSSDLSQVTNKVAWEGLTSIGMVIRECQQGETKTVETRYFITSCKANAKVFAGAVRGHWGIENPLHWRLDVTMGDDTSRIKHDNGTGVLTTIRHICMNLFEREPSKLSMAKKKRKASWSDSFRANLIFS